MKSHEDFLNDFSAKHPNIIVLSQYHGAFATMRFQCTDCGYVWDSAPHTIANCVGCQDCSRRRVALYHTKTADAFLEELSYINNTVEVLDEYKNSWHKVTTRCLVCDYIWKTPPVYLLSGRGCPVCASSKGERAIAAWLDNYRIKYMRQYSYDDLRGVGGRRLSYDFYLPEHNILIEYQGEFHDHSVTFQTDGDFLIQQEHDLRKKHYATTHAIELVKIWYYDYKNIDQILSKLLLQDPVTSIV